MYGVILKKNLCQKIIKSMERFTNKEMSERLIVSNLFWSFRFVSFGRFSFLCADVPTEVYKIVIFHIHCFFFNVE